MRLRSVAAVAACALAWLTPTESHALDLVEFGVGPMVAYGANFLGKPGDKTIGGKPAGDVYPGFGGTSFGYGLMLDVRVIKFLGLEVDFIKRTSRGKGDIDLTVNGVVYPFEVEIQHDATQIPVLLKGVMPVPLFAPYVLVGKEFIRASGAAATYSSKDGRGQLAPVGGYVDNYSYWTFGVGAEVKLPIPGFDLRIPISARGSFNPSISDKLEDRVRIAGNTISAFDTKFQYQVMGTLGVAGYF
ncbi:MAG: hypothetical protein IT374_19400 [Polyangiaceae bacterium]|nr:hypothetical protein [Polyangiaceae bacterium]